MILEIAGYDCLATDEELELQFGKGTPRASTSSEDAEEDHDEENDLGPRGLTRAVRKAEKATMAAKVFGLKEDEGVYREYRKECGGGTSRTWLIVVKRCYVAHGLVPARGHIILTRQYLCFWRRAAVGDDIKVG